MTLKMPKKHKNHLNLLNFAKKFKKIAKISKKHQKLLNNLLTVYWVCVTIKKLSNFGWQRTLKIEQFGKAN